MGGFDGPTSYYIVLYCVLYIDGDGDRDAGKKARKQEEDIVTFIPPFTLYVLVL